MGMRKPRAALARRVVESGTWFNNPTGALQYSSLFPARPAPQLEKRVILFRKS